MEMRAVRKILLLVSFFALSGGYGIAADPLPQTSRSGITPLPAPDSLVIPTTEMKMEFDDFVFDDGVSDSTLEINSRNLYEHHDIYGPGRDASFLETGSHFMSDLEVRTRNPLGENWRSEFFSNIRVTQSRRYDPDDVSLQYLQLIIADDDNNNHLTFGDYYASLSQYSLNRGIKGIGYQRTLNEFSYLRVVSGSFHSRWNYLVERADNEPIDRYGIGMRAQAGRENGFVGLNLVHAWDRNGDPNRTTETTYRQVLPSLDWEYRIAGMRVSGEHAYSSTKLQEVDRSKDTITGTANRINVYGMLGKLRLQTRAEHVTPDFYTMGGGAAIDRLRFFVRGDYRLGRVWSVYVGNDWYRNNLKGRLDATTRTIVPEAGFRAQGLFDRRSLNFSTGLRRRIVETGSPVDRKQITDRVFVSLGDRFKDVSARGEVEFLFHDDKRPAPRSRRDDLLYRLIIDSRHLISDGLLDIRPYLVLERQEVEDATTGRTLYTDLARFDVRVLTRNDLGFGMNAEGRKSYSDIADRDDTKEARYGMYIENRPDILNGAVLRAEAGHNRYDFSDRSRNYRENFVMLTVDLMFNRGI